MATDYSWKSGQIPAFGYWENADDELPITQYFECSRQAGLLRCSCSGDCCGSYKQNNAVDMYSVGFHKPLPRQVYAAPQTKTRGSNKGCSRSKEQRRRRKVSHDSVDGSTNQSLTRKQLHTNHGNKQPALIRNYVTVKPVDEEDLYKIPPELLPKSKTKNILGFFSRCMFPSCST